MQWAAGQVSSDCEGEEGGFQPALPRARSLVGPQCGSLASNTPRPPEVPQDPPEVPQGPPEVPQGPPEVPNGALRAKWSCYTAGRGAG